MSGRSARDLALHDNRARHDAAQVLVVGVPAMPDQGAMHDRRLPANRALGGGGGTGGDAGAPLPDAAGLTYPPADRRARLRHAQSLDGLDALPDEDAAARQYRNEPARSCLQPKASDADRRNRAADAGHEGLSAYRR